MAGRPADSRGGWSMTGSNWGYPAHACTLNSDGIAAVGSGHSYVCVTTAVLPVDSHFHQHTWQHLPWHACNLHAIA
eukprot:333800-Chlamydomonas_euryale.AAC.1